MLDIVMRAISTLEPHPKNARTHSKKQLKQLARSIEKFGFLQPIIVDEQGTNGSTPPPTSCPRQI